MTAGEFEYTVAEPLHWAMSRVQSSELDLAFLPKFWNGVKHIVAKLDSDLITHSLRAMEFDICKMALDHLHLDSDAFVDILAVSKNILKVSPQDFWDGMGTTPPGTWIEQAFESPAFKRILSSLKGLEDEFVVNESLFSWLLPFLASVKLLQHPRVSRQILERLRAVFQSQDVPTPVRNYVLEMALDCMARSLRKIGHSPMSHDSRISGPDMLTVVEDNLDTISEAVTRQPNIAKNGAEMLKEAISLDCECLAADRQLIVDGKNLFPQSCIIHFKIWNATADVLVDDNMTMAKHIFMAARGLIGLEKIVIKQQDRSVGHESKFNSTFDATHHLVKTFLDRVNEYNPADIQKLFDEEDHAHAFLSMLFSSDSGVQSATVEVIKTVSGQTVRKDAFADALSSYLEQVLNAYSNSLRRISQLVTFAPAPNMLKMSKDVLDVLCNSSSGILRTRSFSPSAARSIELFWQALWAELSTIFRSTEPWSAQGRDRSLMLDFCRDVMEFADFLFNQFPVFSSAITNISDSSTPYQSIGERLIDQPKSAMGAMVKWLRLRDDVLLSRSTTLITGILKRLKEFNSRVGTDALYFVENVIVGSTKTLLTPTQKAELHRALETHTGTVFTADEVSTDLNSGPVKQKKTEVINLESWRSKAKTRGLDDLESLVKSSSKSVEAFKSSQMLRKSTPTMAVKPSIAGQKPGQGVSDLVRKRQEETAARKKRDQERVALIRKKAGVQEVDNQTARQGSGIRGLGVVGKDHAPSKGAELMVSSSESESENEDNDLDKELFGETIKTSSRTTEAGRNAQEGRAKRKREMEQTKQQPLKKQRLVRSAKDMRARLVPDLTALHKSMLSWDYFHQGMLPPKADESAYRTVASVFENPAEYQSTFQPLLLLEAWNGLLKVKEEHNVSRPFELRVSSRSSVDSFVEFGSSFGPNESNQVSEGDIILMSKSQTPISTSELPHCLARVSRIQRKGQNLDALYTVLPGSPIVQKLAPNSVCYGQKIMSLIPLEREYGALLGLQYYDLCEEITRARPSPLLDYRDEALEPLMETYELNKAQSKAVKSALDNDAFTLIQGPPGSGKTKTIVATVGALLSQSGQIPYHPKARPPLSGKKLLVCAPSNAAVDELIMRFKEGVKTPSGEHQGISILRLGRSDNINTKVQDVTLDELVKKELSLVSESALKEQTRKLMSDHQDASRKLTALRARPRDSSFPSDEKEMETLRNKKAMLSAKIDVAKDNESMANRQNEMARRQVQQRLIERADVICATLSGSGHDLFQNFSIEFETVVIDEAAQCVELSALIPLKYGCAKCILVGDPQQLPPTVFSKEAANFKYEQSLFVRMQENHPDAVHLLDTQYRMHPEISAFPSKAFYNGKLRDGKDMAWLTERNWNKVPIFGPLQFFDVQGLQQSAPNSRSLFNLAEVEVAMQIFHRLTTDFRDVNFSGKVAMITPYKGQLIKLKDTFKSHHGPDITNQIEFNTTDAFQGRESEIVIFSCVRASAKGTVGFLQDIRRMNVGLTRAKTSLWVLGNSQNLIRGEYWKMFIEHTKSTGRYVHGDLQGLLKTPVERIDDHMETDGLGPNPTQDVEMKMDSSVPASRSPSAVPPKRKLSDLDSNSSRPGSSGSQSSKRSSAVSINSVAMVDAPKSDAGETASESKHVIRNTTAKKADQHRRPSGRSVFFSRQEEKKFRGF